MNVGLCVYDCPMDDLVELAVAADELGIDTLWIGEHIVAPVSPMTKHPTTSDAEHKQLAKPIVGLDVTLIDPWVGMSAIAARTTKLNVGTAIYLVALRHPLVSARAGASLAQLANERVRLGVGAGWLKEEFEALGASFETRGRDLDEAIDIMRRAWAGGPIEHRGTAWHFESVQVVADPVHIPIVVGGNSAPAMRRACVLGDAWFASGTPSIDEALRLHDTLRGVQSSTGRTAPLPVHVRMADPDPDLLPRYSAAGIDHVVVWAHEVWTGDSVDDRRSSLQRFTDRFGIAHK